MQISKKININKIAKIEQQQKLENRYVQTRNDGDVIEHKKTCKKNRKSGSLVW